MVEIDRAAEARRKAQRNGEEDPFTVAQRFLNIFRQLHIFNDEKRNSFNKMLLELSPEIRGMFHSLPGGGVLQEYVDELAEKAGMEKSPASPGLTPDLVDEEVSKAKILATALAEAQIQASVKMQQAAPQATAPVINATPQVQPVQTVIRQETGPSKIEMGENFAQEFAKVISSTLKDNNAEQKEEFRNMIQTLGQTQLEIVKILQSENKERKEEALNLSKMFVQSHNQIAQIMTSPKEPPKIEITNPVNSGHSEESMELMRMLSETQAQMAQTLSQLQNSPQAVINSAPAAAQPNTAPVTQVIKAETDEETKKMIRLLMESQQKTVERLSLLESSNKNDNSREMAQLFAASQQQFAKALATITENHKNDAMEIARVINDSQQQLAQIMVQNNTLNQNSGNAAANNNNANNIQINTTDYSAQLNQIADKLADVTNINTQSLEKVMTEVVKTQSQLYREVAAAQTKELSAIITVALKESQQISTQNIIHAIEAMPKAQVIEKIITAPAYQAPAAQTYQTSRADENIYQEQPLVLKKDFANEPQPEIIPDFDADYPLENLEPQFESATDRTLRQSPVIEEFAMQESGDDENEPAKKKKKKKKKNKNRDIETEMAEVSAAGLDLNLFADNEETENIAEEEFPNTVPASDTSVDSIDSLPIFDDDNDNFDTHSDSNIGNDADDNFLQDLDFDNTETDENTNEEIDPAFDMSFFTMDNYAPTEDEDTKISSDVELTEAEPETVQSLLEEENTTWEYEAAADEELQIETQTDITETVIPEGAEAANSWAYDEAEISAAATEEIPMEAAPEEAENTDAENQDWEWEYESVESSEADFSGEEGQDWEWEYEDSGEEQTSQEINTADNEAVWETEAETVPEVSTFSGIENPEPISTESPICKGDLYFQPEVYKTGTIGTSSVMIAPEVDIVIKDSRKNDNNDDPYQNSAIKH